MPFIQAGIAYGDQECNDCPIQPPTVTFRTNAMKNSDTKNSEFGDVSRFSNADMHQVEHVPACGGEKPPQNWENDAPGLLGAKVVRRKERNYDGNADCRNPVFETRNHREVLVLRSTRNGIGVVQNEASSGRGLRSKNTT